MALVVVCHCGGEGREEVVEEGFVGGEAAGYDCCGAFDGGPEGGGGGCVGWVEGGEGVDGEEAEDGGDADAIRGERGLVSSLLTMFLQGDGGRLRTMRRAGTCLRWRFSGGGWRPCAR